MADTSVREDCRKNMSEIVHYSAATTSRREHQHPQRGDDDTGAQDQSCPLERGSAVLGNNHRINDDILAFGRHRHVSSPSHNQNHTSLDMQQQVKRSRSIQKYVFAKYSYILLQMMLLLVIQQYIASVHAQNPDVDYDLNAENNPNNQFCGISYEEAQSFCYLPPYQSLPCPNGAEVDCPYNMPCWPINETCTQPPTVAPSLRPTKSPITMISSNPGDHYFCGIGFDNLFDW